MILKVLDDTKSSDIVKIIKLTKILIELCDYDIDKADAIIGELTKDE